MDILPSPLLFFEYSSPPYRPSSRDNNFTFMNKRDGLWKDKMKCDTPILLEELLMAYL